MSRQCLSLSTAETFPCLPVFVAAFSAREAAAVDDSPPAAEPVAAQPVAAVTAGEPARFAAEARARYAAPLREPRLVVGKFEACVGGRPCFGLAPQL